MKPRILVADDEPTLLRLLRTLLEENGYEVETASSAAEALRKLEDSVFHLVLTDMSMETHTAGFAVIEGAKRQPYKPAIAILTAFPLLGAGWQDKGADAIFIKGTSLQDMLRWIEQELRRAE